MRIKTTTKKAFIMLNNNKIIFTEIETWQKKFNILKNKYKLKGNKVYVESHLTIEERNIQSRIRIIAKNLKEKKNMLE